MNSHRQLFSSLLGAETGEQARRMFSPARLRTCLDAVPAAQQAGGVDFASPQALAGLAQVASQRLQAIAKGWHRLRQRVSNGEGCIDVLRAKAVREAAPLLVGSQHLIHSVCASWNNEAPYAMNILRIHAADVGSGLPEASRIHRYRELLREFAPSDAGEDPQRIGDDSSICEGAFNFASMLVVLGHFPESFLPQILGINLYLRHCELIPMFAIIVDEQPSLARFLDLRNDPANSTQDLAELAETAVLEYLGQEDPSVMEGVRQGYQWARWQTETASTAMLAVLERWLDPREAARDLITRRRPDACQYHEKTRLNKVPMKPLLEADDSLAFLDHLANSSYVRAGSPERSPLLTTLVSPRSKMFRIFSREDISILERWIAGLPYSDQPSPYPARTLWTDDGLLMEAASETVAVPILKTNLTPRQAYPRLLHVELTPAEENHALSYVKRWLSNAARGVTNGRCTLPEHWAPGMLRTWLQRQHVLSNQTLDQAEELPSREEVAADIISLAPLTMIDGAWLAGFAHPSLASSSFGSRLFETLYDELGNGMEAQNHPVIYRQLLRAVHGELPTTAAPGYAASECFFEENFDLPVFWLSIGRYPQTFCPEILGLNLAMELSGVGGGYRRTHKALVAYGYPTLFVDLHNAIDNISTGHTAWAAASIDAYLSAFCTKDRDELWVRIRTGFVALNPPREETILDKLKERMRSLL
ncbi:iron-containing redox enzyme family protein [Pseudomonas corrugata]